MLPQVHPESVALTESEGGRGHVPGTRAKTNTGNLQRHTPSPRKESVTGKESFKVFQNGGVENDLVEEHGYRRQRTEMHPSNEKWPQEETRIVENKAISKNLTDTLSGVEDPGMPVLDKDQNDLGTPRQNC